MQTDRWHPGKCSVFLCRQRAQLVMALPGGITGHTARTLLFARRVKLIEIPFLPHRRLASVHGAILQPISHSAGVEWWNQTANTQGGSISPKVARRAIFHILHFQLPLIWEWNGKRNLQTSLLISYFSINPLNNTSHGQFEGHSKGFLRTLAPLWHL